MDFKNFIVKNKFNILILFIWFFIVTLTMFNHELWRDEAQAWCIVRDLKFLDIVNASKTEGHPVLWYLLLYPFAKNGFSVFSMQIVSFLFVFLSVIILIFKSHFNNLQKILIIFSAGMIYYLPVISRNYSLIPLFLFIIAFLYPQRLVKPYKYVFFLVLLSQTHIYMLGLSVSLFILFGYEKIKEYKKQNKLSILTPLFILLLNFGFIFLMFYGARSDNYALNENVRNFMPFGQVCGIISKVLSFEILGICDFTKQYSSLISWLLLYPCVFGILFSFFKSDKKVFFILFTSISYILFVFTNIYFNGILYQKIFLIFLILIFCFWICPKKDRIGIICFEMILFISCITSFFVINKEIRYDFSGSKKTAEFIKKNLSDEKVFIAAGNPYLYSSISAYLPGIKFYNLFTESYITFYSYKNSVGLKKDIYPEDAKYSIVQENIQIPADKNVKVIFQNEDKIISSKTEREVFFMTY